MVVHTCSNCGKQFNHKAPYDYHMYKMKTPCDRYKKYKIKQPQNDTHECKELFKCSNCNKTYTRKDNFKRHILNYCPFEDVGNNTKKTTKVDLDHVKIDKSDNLHTLSDDDDVISNSSLSSTLPNNFTTPLNSESEDNYKCNYCQKTFTRSDNLNRHLKNICKVKKQHDAEKEIMFQKLVQQMDNQNKKMNEQNKKMDLIIEENKELKCKLSTNESPTLTNNTDNTANTANTINTTIDNSQNIQNNNIKLVAFGEEDLSYITTGICKRILNKGFRSVPVLIKYNHFHENKPEFHNVYISNMQNSHAAIYNGIQWKLISKTEAVERLIHDGKYYLIEKFEELFEELDPVTIKKFNRFINQSEDDEVLNGLKRDIRYMLYNNKNLPEKTRRLLQEQDDECKLIEG